MANIHPSSIVAPGAKLADSVEVGPFCYIGPNVVIGEGSRLIGHCNIDGHTTIGSGNTFFPFSAIGQRAQDHGVVPGSVSYVVIGDNNEFREGSMVHSGTKPESTTRVGSGCMFMNGCHIAHNCEVGNNVIMAGLSELAGYTQVFDNAVISGVCAIHQFCRVGRFAMISGGSVFSKDVPPFMIVEGRNGVAKAINLVGLTRGGFSEETIRTIKHLHRIYYRSDLAPINALKEIREKLPQTPEVVEFLEFCASSKRGIVS